MGWVKPYALGDYHETIILENSFFVMLKVKSKSKLMSYITKEHFVIALKLTPQKKVIASADQEAPLHEQWDWIETNLKNTLSDDVNLRDEMLAFLESKFEIFADMEAQKKLKAEADELFSKTFQLEDEAMIYYYNCSLWTSSSGLSQGYLYLTDHHLCFSSLVGKHTVVIPLKSITSISKEKVLRLNNGIKLMIGAREEDSFLFSFFHRDEAYDYITTLWDIALESILRKEEGPINSVAQVFESHELLRRGITVPQHILPACIKDSEGIKKHRNNVNYQNLFHLPQVETLEKIFGVKKFKFGNNNSVSGLLYLGKNFLCFQSNSKDTDIQLVIPYAFLKDIKLEIVQKNSFLQLQTIKNSSIQFTVRNREAQQCVEELQLLHKISLVQNKDTQMTKYFEIQFDERIRELKAISLTSPSLARKTLEENQNEQAMIDLETWKRWEEYFDTFGEGFSMIKTPKFYELINNHGISDQLRGIMWQLCSGSTYLRFLLEGQNYYASLLKKQPKNQSNQSSNNASSSDPNQDSDNTDNSNIPSNFDSVIADEIEKDLHRSLPEHTFYQSQAGIDSLRRVLLAYSAHNQEVGYCQAMNIVAALLLLYMSEEAAFYMLCILCEVFMPRSYSRAMIGAIIDQNVFESLLEEKLPDLHAFFEKKNVPVPAVTMGWFICLFIGYLPFQVTLRIMDSFFVHGVTVLYKAALTIMSIYKPKLMAQKDGYMVASLLKTNELDITAEDLFLIMHRDFSDITPEKMEVKRRHAKYSYIRELQSSNKNTQFAGLLKTTQFSQNSLEALYNAYSDATKNDTSKSPLLTFKCFSRVMKLYPWWADLTDYEKNKLFVKLTPRQATAVSFADLASGLDPWIHGGLISRFTSCFRLFDYDNDDMVTFEQLVRTFDMLCRLSIHEEAPPSITTSNPKNKLPIVEQPKKIIDSETAEQFVAMIFDKLDLKENQKASYAAVRGVAFDVPLFVGFFGLEIQ